MEVLKRGALLTVRDARLGKRWADSPHLSYGMVSYIGAPIVLPGAQACLSFFSSRPRLYSHADRKIVILLAELIGGEIALYTEKERNQYLSERVTSFERSILRIIDHVPYMIQIQDQNGNSIFMNKVFREFHTRARTNHPYPQTGRKDSVGVLQFLHALEDIKLNLGNRRIEEKTVHDSRGKPHIIIQETTPFYVGDSESPCCIELGRDITGERKRHLLMRHKAVLYEGVIEDQTELILRFLPEGEILFANNAFCVFFGKKRRGLIGSDAFSIFPEGDRDKLRSAFSFLTQDHPITTYEQVRPASGGASSCIEWSCRAIFSPEGGLSEYQAVGRDITERVAMEEALRRSVAEKELLLKEVHHRVKNNLAVIVSLIRLGYDRLDSEQGRAVFSDLENRVGSIALVHEKLYRSNDLSGIDLCEYVRDLANQVLATFPLHTAVDVDVSIPDVFLPLDMAMPIGLIINELLTNSVKYAFTGREKGMIRIAVERDEKYELRYTDDGVGMPVENDACGSLGLKLVRGLVDQIGGTLRMDCDRGTSFFIRFAVP